MKIFFKQLFSAGDEASMKRFVGLLLILALINLSYFVGLKLIDVTTWQAIESWLRALLYSADLFLGLGAVLDGAKIIRGTDKPVDKQP